MAQNTKLIQLHIMHSWGGGLERWVDDYCRADQQHINLILKSLGVPGIPGKEIALYKRVQEREPLKIWQLTPYIYNTALAHLQYCYLLEEIIKDYQVSRLLISSLIGHSLDALNTGLKTIFIAHDYYPFCPALNIYFHKVCDQCTTQDLKQCSEENPYNRFLPMSSPEDWGQLRQYFSKLILENQIPLVVPSQSVQKHLVTLDPTFKLAEFVVIPHGIKIPKNLHQLTPNSSFKPRLKILVLGSVSLHKGFYLLQEITPKIADFAEVLLLGYGEEGVPLTTIKGVRPVAKNYRRKNLLAMIQKLSPDLGLLLSVWPETFNYTLSELQMMGLPTLTTNVGSFPERVVDQINGFLVEPKSKVIISKIKELYENQDIITKVAEKVQTQSHKSLEMMLQEYETVLASTFVPKQRLSREISLVERLSLKPDHNTAKVEEIAALKQQIEAMETSKFWKLRKAWFNLKKVMGLPIDE